MRDIHKEQRGDSSLALGQRLLLNPFVFSFTGIIIAFIHGFSDRQHDGDKDRDPHLHSSPGSYIALLRREKECLVGAFFQLHPSENA
jgi:hypothetical protein